MALDDVPDQDWLWPNGVMVNQTEGEFIWVVRQIVNWRLMTVPKADQSMYRRWWCYQGTDYFSLCIAVYAGMKYGGEGDPLAWSKNGQTGVWREREDALTDIGVMETWPPAKLAEFHGYLDQGMKSSLTDGIVIP